MDTIGGESERRNLAVESWRWGWRLAPMMEAGGTQMKMEDGDGDERCMIKAYGICLTA